MAFTQHDLLIRAADYFAQARKPRAEWKNLDDLAAQLANLNCVVKRVIMIQLQSVLLKLILNI